VTRGEGAAPGWRPGGLKRLAYNLAWSKVDPLWVAIVRLGLMPFATRIFHRVLQVDTRPAGVPGFVADEQHQDVTVLPSEGG
jgi:hypothetical protein